MRTCRRCHEDFVGAHGLQAHDCDELYSEGSIAWHFAGEDYSLDDYVEVSEYV